MGEIVCLIRQPELDGRAGVTDYAATMRIHPVLVLAPLLLGGTAFAQTAAQPTFTAERVRAHVAYLADDRLEGRDTGSRGYDLAAKYVSDQFASFGLKPAGDNGTWYQQVTFQRTQPGASKGRSESVV